ncbi:MAG: hypothetical protein J0M02_06505 [Planctomycetes bacterium]|nr:hypothetical protein [Planctomycetota bacterium]
MPRPTAFISLLLGLLVVAGTGVWLWRVNTVEPMASFRDFPWTYITEAAMGTDENRVIIDRGHINGPTSVIDAASGQTAWPAYIHPDPAVVPLVAGKPLIFPLMPNGNGMRSPVLAPLGRPLNQREIETVERYLTPEGRDRMDAFRKEMSR